MNTAAPPCGAEARALWTLEPDAIFLNHGSFGACSRPVLQAQQRWRDRMEAQPVRFFRREEGPATRAAATALAQLVGASPDRVVMVDNTTSGVSAVLRSLPYAPGATLLCLSHAYPAVRGALLRICAERGYTLRVVPLPCPVRDPAQVLQLLAESLQGVSLAVLDQVTSYSGLVLPVAEMVALCRAQGVHTLVDGAHAPGLLPLNLDQVGATWTVGNIHKWLCSPKGAALLHAAADAPFDVHPPAWSHGLGLGLVAEFDFVGTQDHSAWWVVPELLEFWRWFGLERARAYNHELCLQARSLLLRTLGTEAAGPESMIASMASVRLPERFGAPTLEAADRVHDRLWDEHHIEVPVVPLLGALWIRVSAQVYNQAWEYERLAQVLVGWR